MAVRGARVAARDLLLCLWRRDKLRECAGIGAFSVTDLVLKPVRCPGDGSVSADEVAMQQRAPAADVDPRLRRPPALPNVPPPPPLPPAPARLSRCAVQACALH